MAAGGVRCCKERTLMVTRPQKMRITVCNLYSITTNQAAIAELFRIVNRYVGNLPPMRGVFPPAPPSCG